jgi:hypothetical protein
MQGNNYCRIMKKYYNKLFLFFAVLITASSLFAIPPSGKHKNSFISKDELIKEGTAKFLELLKANQQYEKNSNWDKTNYTILIGDYGNAPLIDTPGFYVRKITGTPDLTPEGSNDFNKINDSLKKWNQGSETKTYMLFVSGLTIVIDKELKSQTIKGMFDDLRTKPAVDAAKEAHNDITYCIFRSVTSSTTAGKTILFSIGNYKMTDEFKVNLAANDGTHLIGSYSLWVTYPIKTNLAEESDRKRIIRMVGGIMREKPDYHDSYLPVLYDMRDAIGYAKGQLVKHKQILLATSASQLDELFESFGTGDYSALTLKERIHALKLMAASTMGNNGTNHREYFATQIVEETPGAQQNELLDSFSVAKLYNSNTLLLKELIHNIDNGHIPLLNTNAHDFDNFIMALARIILNARPPAQDFTFAKAMKENHAFGFKPGFWFGDNVSQNFTNNGQVVLQAIHGNPPVSAFALSTTPYDYVWITFNGEFTIGTTTLKKGELLRTPALVAMLVFNNENSEKIKTGIRICFDAALMLTGIGELDAALQAKNGWMMFKACWNLGWGASGFILNDLLGEKLQQTKWGSQVLHWYNMASIFAAPVGFLKKSPSEIITNLKNSVSAAKAELNNINNLNQMVKETELGTGVVTFTTEERTAANQAFDDMEREGLAKVNAAALDGFMDDIYATQRSVVNENRNIIANANNNSKGAFGEIASDAFLTEKGFQPLHHRKTALTEGWGETGIDGVFKKDGQYYIVEAKYGTATLSPANQATGLPKQMSDSWILGDNRLLNVVGPTIFQDINAVGYRRILATVGSDGSIVYKELDASANVIGIITP